MIAHKKKKNGFTNCLSGIWLPLYSVQIFASLILRSAASIVTDETNRTNIKVWNWKYVMKRALNSHSSTDCIPASSCKTSNTLQAWLLGGTQVRNGVYFVSLTFSTHVLHAHAEAVPSMCSTTHFFKNQTYLHDGSPSISLRGSSKGSPIGCDYGLKLCMSSKLLMSKISAMSRYSSIRMCNSLSVQRAL